MEISVRDAKARFSEAAAAALRGERVIVTRHGQPFVELVPPRPTGGLDLARAAAVSKALGFDGTLATDELWPDEFDDPAFSREVLGLGR